MKRVIVSFERDGWLGKCRGSFTPIFVSSIFCTCNVCVTETTRCVRTLGIVKCNLQSSALFVCRDWPFSSTKVNKKRQLRECASLSLSLTHSLTHRLDCYRRLLFFSRRLFIIVRVALENILDERVASHRAAGQGSMAVKWPRFAANFSERREFSR